MPDFRSERKRKRPIDDLKGITVYYSKVFCKVRTSEKLRDTYRRDFFTGKKAVK